MRSKAQLSLEMLFLYCAFFIFLILISTQLFALYSKAVLKLKEHALQNIKSVIENALKKAAVLDEGNIITVDIPIALHLSGKNKTLEVSSNDKKEKIFLKHNLCKAVNLSLKKGSRLKIFRKNNKLCITAD